MRDEQMAWRDDRGAVAERVGALDCPGMPPRRCSCRGQNGYRAGPASGCDRGAVMNYCVDANELNRFGVDAQGPRRGGDFLPRRVRGASRRTRRATEHRHSRTDLEHPGEDCGAERRAVARTSRDCALSRESGHDRTRRHARGPRGRARDIPRAHPGECAASFRGEPGCKYLDVTWDVQRPMCFNFLRRRACTRRIPRRTLPGGARRLMRACTPRQSPLQ